MDDVISDLDEAKKITSLFNDYYRIHLGYTHNFYNNKTALLQGRLNEWKTMFNEVFAENIRLIFNNLPIIYCMMWLRLEI